MLNSGVAPVWGWGGWRYATAVAAVLCVVSVAAVLRADAAVTAREWVQVGFTYYIQKPWNLDVSDRYGYNSSSNRHAMWIMSTDEPHAPGDDTDPRTEMRWQNNYRSGAHRWEADVYVSKGTAGTILMQVIDYNGTWVPAFMLRVYADDGGSFWRYRAEGSAAILQTGVYSKWWNVKVIHDADAGWIAVVINDMFVDWYVVEKRSPNSVFNFKNGVYGTLNPKAMAHFRNLKYWRLL
jgi:hypothetical protein